MISVLGTQRYPSTLTISEAAGLESRAGRTSAPGVEDGSIGSGPKAGGTSARPGTELDGGTTGSGPGVAGSGLGEEGLPS